MSVHDSASAAHTAVGVVFAWTTSEPWHPVAPGRAGPCGGDGGTPRRIPVPTADPGKRAVTPRAARDAGAPGGAGTDAGPAIGGVLSTLMPDREDSGADCLIVGAGLSGLACAHGIASQGYTVQVLEADGVVGGRTRTRFHQGEPVDEGFQALFQAYPETRAFLGEIGIGNDQLRAFDRGVVVFDGARWLRLRPNLGGARRAGLASLRPLARVALAAARSAGAPTRHLVDGDERTAEQYFRDLDVPDRTVELAIRPLLGSMTLDRSLSADAGYAEFLTAMLIRGPAVLPVDGIGMIATRAAEEITRAGGMIWTGVRVASLDCDASGRVVRGVVLDDGRRVAARHVVLALDPPNAAALLRDADPGSAGRLPTEALGTVSAAFALQHPLYEDKTVLLDGAADEATDRVDLLCQTTNVTRPGSPGPHILIAQSATRGWRDVDPERYVRAVGERIRNWAPRFPWERVARPIGAFVHDWAQYRVTPGVRRALPGPRTSLTNVVLAGDAVTHPSIEGAVSSGRRAARVVLGILQ